MNIIKQKTETRAVRHDFTPKESQDLGKLLAQELGARSSKESEFDSVKSDYKAKLASFDARIQEISTNLVNGFDVRSVPCVILFRPADKKKDFFVESEVAAYAEGTGTMPKPVLTLDMTPEDFQSELIEAESKFDAREEIAIFPSVDGSYGTLVVGRFAGKWFSALRIKIGRAQLEERLDSEQKSFKARPDAVSSAGKRAMEWLNTTLKEHAKGFADPIASAIAAHAERAE